MNRPDVIRLYSYLYPEAEYPEYDIIESIVEELKELRDAEDIEKLEGALRLLGIESFIRSDYTDKREYSHELTNIIRKHITSEYVPSDISHLEKDLRILQELGDRKLLEMCLADPDVNDLCKNEIFWIERYYDNFFLYQKFKTQPRSWRNYYLESLIREESELADRKNKILLLYQDPNESVNRKRLIELMRKIINAKYTDSLDIGIIPVNTETFLLGTKALDRAKSQYRKLVFFLPHDNYANEDRDKKQVIDNYLDTLQRYGDIIPSLSLIRYVASKYYARDFKDMMLDNTLIYPDDKNIISKIPQGDYAVKFGYSSGNMGVVIVKNKNGMMIIESIEGVKKRINDFAIIQPLFYLFGKCDEYRILVVNGKIEEVYHGFISKTGNRNIKNGDFKANTYKFSANQNLYINPLIYSFVKNVYNRLLKILNTDNVVGLRIDIVVECSNIPIGDYSSNVLPDIFNPEWKGKIYLNEIDTMASGVWGVTHRDINFYNTPFYKTLSETAKQCNVQINDNNAIGQVRSISQSYGDYCMSEYDLTTAIINKILI